mgnify:CR=1 FL=1
MAGMMKHKKPRKFSQASMKSFTKKKPVPEPEDIFIFDSVEEKEMYERLKQQAIEEANLRKEALNHKFIKGKKYFISDKGNYKPEDNESFVFIYLKKQGRHHVFQHAAGGWLTTRTDQQLIGKKIQEVKP